MWAFVFNPIICHMFDVHTNIYINISLEHAKRISLSTFNDYVYHEPFARTLLGAEFACHITILSIFFFYPHVTTDDAFCHDFQQNAIEYNTNVSTELYGYHIWIVLI